MKPRHNHRPYKPSGLRKNTGFSLVEVLLALFLVAMVIGIASEVAGNSVRNVTSLKESTFARWVALNQLDGYKIEIAQGATPSAGGDSGEAEMGNMSWRWVREVTTSGSDALLEVRVTVFRADDRSDEDPVMMVKGYIPAP
ncbi:MAG: type II secretion system minor pseudopilin GspI [Thiolinea sp.]